MSSHDTKIADADLAIAIDISSYSCCSRSHFDANRRWSSFCFRSELIPEYSGRDFDRTRSRYGHILRLKAELEQFRISSYSMIGTSASQNEANFARLACN